MSNGTCHLWWNHSNHPGEASFTSPGVAQLRIHGLAAGCPSAVPWQEQPGCRGLGYFFLESLQESHIDLTGRVLFTQEHWTIKFLSKHPHVFIHRHFTEKNKCMLTVNLWPPCRQRGFGLRCCEVCRKSGISTWVTQWSFLLPQVWWAWVIHWVKVYLEVSNHCYLQKTMQEMQ